MSSSVDKSSVLDLCDFELAQIDAQQRKSGWTPWILWAAAAGLAWQSLTFLGGSRNWLEVGVCWGIFVLVADLLRSLFTLSLIHI